MNFRDLHDYGFDLRAGFQYTGGSEMYLEVLKSFYEDYQNNLNTFEEYISNNDVNDYTIAIHALKSNAKTIGATKLFEHALELEMLGKSGDMPSIKEKMPDFLLEYKEVIELLKQYSDASDDNEADDNKADDNKADDNKADDSDAHDACAEKEASVIEDSSDDNVTADNGDIVEILSQIETALSNFQDETAIAFIDALIDMKLGAMYNTMLVKAKNNVRQYDYVDATEIIVELKKLL